MQIPIMNIVFGLQKKTLMRFFLNVYTLLATGESISFTSLINSYAFKQSNMYLGNLGNNIH